MADLTAEALYNQCLADWHSIHVMPMPAGGDRSLHSRRQEQMAAARLQEALRELRVGSGVGSGPLPAETAGLGDKLTAIWRSGRWHFAFPDATIPGVPPVDPPP